MRRRSILIPLSAAVAVFAVAVLAVESAPTAWAHTEVQRATPGPGAALAGPVERVDLLFLDPVLPTVTIEVRGPDGDLVDGLGPVEFGQDGRAASVDFDAVSAEGDYVVEYDFVAEDGDAQSDAYRFSVTGGAQGATGRSGWIALGAAIAVVALALTIALRRRRAS